jgi:transposase InsO family protein
LTPEEHARQLALLRFAVIRDLLVDPPDRGDLAEALRALAQSTWKLPDGSPTQFGFSTIEGWYYLAKGQADPVRALTSAVRSDRGTRRAIDDTLLRDLRHQYEQHPGWTAKLHHSNLAALIREKYPDTYSIPSYATVRRTLKAQGWTRRRRARTKGQERAQERLERRETRRFEASHAHALWHLDFHEGSRKVMTKDGRYRTAKAFAVLDDHTRVVCHVQWYLAEDTERLVHGFIQALLKRGLPGELMHDNGSAMTSADFQQGLQDLGITSCPTLAYSPHQNGKMEKFWDALEGTVVALLEKVEPLTLDLLNRASQAWVERDYHREKHAGIEEPPIERLARASSVARAAPDTDALRFAFTRQEKRTQRRSDGTVMLFGVRFEVPSRLRTLETLTIRCRRWDLSHAWVVDPRTRDVLARIVPDDPTQRADGRRKPIEPPNVGAPNATNHDPMPPKLRELLADYAADGTPPAFFALDDNDLENP